MNQEQEPSRPRPSLVIPVAVAAAVVGAVVCYVLTVPAKLGQPVPALAAGPIAAGLVRLLLGTLPRQEAIIIAGLALAGSLAGFVWGDYHLWTPFMAGETVRRILSLTGIIVFAATAYLAYVVVLRRD